VRFVCGRYYPRVLYIDFDIHHGDGVEEAFFTTDRGELIVSGDVSKAAVLTIVWRGVSYP